MNNSDVALSSQALLPLPAQPLLLRASLLVLWLALWVYSIVFAPPQQLNDLDYLLAMLRFDSSQAEPWAIVLFALLLLWPMMMAAILLIDSRGQRIPAWPFIVPAFVVGNFVLLLYLVVRRSNPRFQGGAGRFLQGLDSRPFGSLLLLIALSLLVYGFQYGDIQQFIDLLKVSNPLNIMAVDFVLYLLGFACVLRDDMARRGFHNPVLFWFYVLVPVIGAGIYLATRPPLLVNPID